MTAANSLLPSGFFDLLPPDARQQRKLHQQILDSFSSFGYLEVCPPLMEFETSLLAGKTAPLAAQTFRIMDPQSREMMGIRTDMTMQIARIATSRLGDQPKPLRLCYAGMCLRVTGEGLRRERQFMQAGAELIGSESLAADIEIIRVAVESLTPLGLGEITVDFNLPRLSQTLLAHLPETLQPRCRQAIQQKDRSGLADIDHPLIPGLLALLEATGCEDPAAIDREKLPADAQQMLTDWIARITQLKAAGIPARMTLDPLEQQGFEYYSDLAFSLFASNVESEIGRGGRYLLNDETPATGFTIYLNPLRHRMKHPTETQKCYLPYGTTPETSAKLRAEGWTVVHGLSEEPAPAESAVKFGCTHLLQNERLLPLQEKENH